MTFEEKIEKVFEEAEEELVLDLLHAGFAFDREIEGERVAFRRSKDELKEDTVETEFFCFPQNGQRDKLKHGMLVRFAAKPENPDELLVRFGSPKKLSTKRPEKSETYYSQVASRAGREIEKEGANTYLHHDVMIRTPEKDVVGLDAFDFEANKLFMLGLYGGEYQCFAVKKKN